QFQLEVKNNNAANVLAHQYKLLVAGMEVELSHPEMIGEDSQLVVNPSILRGFSQDRNVYARIELNKKRPISLYFEKNEEGKSDLKGQTHCIVKDVNSLAQKAVSPAAIF